MLKRPIILTFSIIMLSMALTSCEEEYSIPTDGFEEELVINSLFTNDEPWSVHVSNTNNVLDHQTSVRDITDAKVEVFDQNGKFIEQLDHVGDGNYEREDFYPSSKRGYHIKVSAPGFRTVTAYSFVPEESTLVINEFEITGDEKRQDVEVDFQIEDRSKLDSYYVWEIVSIEDNEEGDSESTNQLSKDWLDDLTNNPDDLINDSREILENISFGDGKYQGTYNSSDGNRRINVKNNIDDEDLVNYWYENQPIGKVDPNINYLHENVGNNDFGDGSTEEGDGNKISYNYELRVMSISKELYDYYHSVEEYLRHDTNNHSNQIPYKIYTNVEQGQGIFAGFSESVIQF